MKKIFLSCLAIVPFILSAPVNAISVNDIKDIKQQVLNGGSADIYDCISIKHDLLFSQKETTTNKITVSTVDELKSALKNAQPNDEIILKSGIYETDQSGTKASLFMSSADGTAENPIIIRSENPDDMAHLKGMNEAEKIALYITGDNWIIKDLEVSTAQKGIVLDNSNNSLIENCNVHNTGSEGIHLRDDSSYCIVNKCSVHDTGTVSPSYGEAVYIGSAYTTNGYGYKCDYNTIKNCTFTNISAEHVDIKEYTTGTIIENCIMDGTGMTGANYADSFIDIKGNNCIIRNNTCYRNNNPTVVDAFQIHVQVDGWGIDNEVYDNILYLDDETPYVLTGWDGSVTAYNNTRIPAGNMYYGDAITEIFPLTTLPV